MKWLIGMATAGILVVVTYVVLAVSSSPGPGSTIRGYPHWLLEQDRAMTQQMAVQISMGPDGMLERSADPGYVKALEEHTYQFNRMLGLVP